MSAKKRVIFICSGNICRSPMAAAMLSDWIEKRPLDLEVSSAGTLGIEDHAADPDAIEALEEEDLDLRSHRSRGISREIIEDAFAVIVWQAAGITPRAAGLLWAEAVAAEQVAVVAAVGSVGALAAAVASPQRAARRLRRHRKEGERLSARLHVSLPLTLTHGADGGAG